MAKKAEPTAPDTAAPKDETSQSAVDWARSILWAVEHINVARMTKRKAGSLMRFSLWEFGRENPKELVVRLASEAMRILDKNKQGADEAEIAEAERRSIKELEDLLRDAVAEARAE